MTSNKIAIFGAGYVGLTTAVLLANSNNKVTLIETNPSRLKVLRAGKSFFYEQGIDELLGQALRNKSLVLTDDSIPILGSQDIIFSCVGTPSNADGSCNLAYVFSVAKTIAEHAKPETVFVQKSTVPVGTGGKTDIIFKSFGNNLHYVSNPEFLREGTAVQDSLWFDRVVVGGDNKRANQKVLDLYRSIESNRNRLAAISGLSEVPDIVSKYILTNRNSAELIKVTANAFLALKISFANSIAKLADHSGADVNEVMDAVGADSRIGRAFLDAGRGYGGGCFPKDVSGLISSAEEYGVDMPIMAAATSVNDSMPGYIANKAQEAMGTLTGKRVAVLGLSFKAGTSDARKSPGVKLANILHSSGAIVTTYDPHANGEAKEELKRSIAVCKSTADAVKGVDAVFITTSWPEFLGIDLKELAGKMSGSLFYDAVNCFNPSDVEQSGLQYLGVGRS